MKKRRFIFWLDITQFGLWILVILTILPEVFSHSFVHIAAAVLLLIGAGIHLWMHREWITVAFKHLGKMPKQARENALLNLGLFGLYAVCGGLGLLARLMYYISPHQHLHFGVFHALLAFCLAILQILHLARHWKWIRTNVRVRLLEGI